MFHSLNRFLSAHQCDTELTIPLLCRLSFSLARSPSLSLSAGFRTRVIGLPHAALPRTDTGLGSREREGDRWVHVARRKRNGSGEEKGTEKFARHDERVTSDGMMGKTELDFSVHPPWNPPLGVTGLWYLSRERQGWESKRCMSCSVSCYIRPTLCVDSVSGISLRNKLFLLAQFAVSTTAHLSEQAFIPSFQSTGCEQVWIRYSCHFRGVELIGGPI